MTAKRYTTSCFRRLCQLGAVLMVLLALAAVVLLWPRPVPPKEFYLESGVNAVATVRLDTADQGYEPVIQALLGAQMSPSETAMVERLRQTLLDARLLFFLKDGEDDVYQTSLMAVAHPRRMAPAFRFLVEEILKSEALDPDRTVHGVGLYPLDIGGWAAVTSAGFLYTNDIDWADSVVSRHAAGAQPDTDSSDEFLRRARAMSAPHEVRALAQMTPHRRGATERLLANLLEAFTTLEQDEIIRPIVNDLMEHVVFLEVDVDLQPQYRAETVLWFDTTSSVEARNLATRMGRLREALATLLAGAGIEVTNIRLQGQRVVLEGRFQNIAPYLSALYE